MPEQTVSLKLKVQDDGSIVLDRFSGKLETIPKHVDSMNRSLSLIKWDSIVNLGQKVIQAAERFYAFGKSIASAANDIERQAGIVGMSTTEWQKWTYAAKMSDASTESLMTGMRMLSGNIVEARKEGSEANKIFKALGITETELIPIALQIADKFSKSQDGAEKMNYAVKLLGRGAMDLIPLFNQGGAGIKVFGDEAVKMGTVLGDVVIKKGSEADQMFKKLESQINATKISLAPLVLEFAKLAENIADAVKWMDKWSTIPATPRGTPPYAEHFLRQFGLNFFIPGVESQGDMMRRMAMEEYTKATWPSETRFIGMGKGKLPAFAGAGETGPWSAYGISKDEFERIKDSLEQIKRYTKDWIEEYNEMWKAPEGWEWAKGFSDQTKMAVEEEKKNLEDLMRFRSEIFEKGPLTQPAMRGKGGAILPAETYFPGLAMVEDEIKVIENRLAEMKGKTEDILVPSSETLAKWGKQYADTIEEIDTEWGRTKIADPNALGIPAKGDVVIGGRIFKLDDLYKYKDIEEELRQQRLSVPAEDNWQYWERVVPTMGPTTEYQNAMKKVAEEEKRAAFWGQQINRGLDVMGSAVMNLKDGWQGFFQTMGQGFAKLLQDISMAILKAQILTQIPKQFGGTSTGGWFPFFKTGDSGGTSPPGAGAGTGGALPGGGGIINIGTYIERVDATDVNSFERRYGSTIVGINREHNRKQTSRRGAV